MSERPGSAAGAPRERRARRCGCGGSGFRVSPAERCHPLSIFEGSDRSGYEMVSVSDAAGTMELITATYKRPGGGCGRATAPRRGGGMGLRPAALALLALAAAASALPLPLPDAGPHLNYGWGEPIRLRHLYTASKHGLFSCFLRIGADGRVDAAGSQSPQSECRPRGWGRGRGRGRTAGVTLLSPLSLCPQVCWRSAPWPCAPWPSRACRAPGTCAWTRRGGCTAR